MLQPWTLGRGRSGSVGGSRGLQVRQGWGEFLGWKRGSESGEESRHRWHGQSLNLMKAVSLWRTWGEDKVSRGLGIMRVASWGALGC